MSQFILLPLFAESQFVGKLGLQNLEGLVDAEVIPFVSKIVVSQNWQVSFYKEFESVLFDEGELVDEIQKMIQFAEYTKDLEGFRREVIVKNFPFLCALRLEEKSIYIGTRRLSRELSLLKLFEENFFELGTEEERKIFNLKDHVEKISTLSPSQFPSEIEWVTFHSNLPNLLDTLEWSDVDEKSKVILKQLVKKVSSYHSSLFEKISDYGLTLTAQYDLIRVHLLKFLALLPSLDHDKRGQEVKRILIESLRRLIEDARSISSTKKRGTRQLPTYLLFIFSFFHNFCLYIPARFLALSVRTLVKMMAKRFIAGESIRTSNETLRRLRNTKRQATLDQLGELVVSEKEADEYFEKVLQLIHGLNQHITKGEKNNAGIYNAHVSIKVSALSHDFRPQAFDFTFSKVAPRLKRILIEAQREEVFINIDAEHYQYRDLVFEIYEKVLLESAELKDFSQTGIVVQAYLRDGASHLLDVVELAKKRNIRMPIRLVKGAYWDAETIEGEAHQFTPPQFLNKEESDLHFRQLAYLSLKNHDHIQLAIGSHNLQDHAFVEALRELRFPQSPVIEHQCLHMTYEALSHGLADMGWPTRNYMPIGNLLVGMAYLVRRIMENSSQVGVLSIMRSHRKASGLISPEEVHMKKKESQSLILDSFVTQLKNNFTPVRPLKLYVHSERKPFENEIEKFLQKTLEKQSEFSQFKGKKITCSSRPELILGTINENSSTEAILSVEECHDSLKNSNWGNDSFAFYRVAAMLKAADLMLLRRNQLASLIIFEAGKTMTEALADVDEAIDFINFYARDEIQLQLSGQKITNRGVFAVIAPWNFPLAIPCGMVVAPLVAGNAVILKPAEQTPLIAMELHKLLIEAGVPKNIFHIILGDGEIVGAPLVTHEKTAGIVFTGSKNVGKWIYRHAAKENIVHYKHQFMMQKKVITEMGGKNAIVVTNNCELDETISGILYAAFGHAGQKCSAASRVIVHKQVKEALITRLVEAIKDIKVGESLDPSTYINPLITQEDQERVRAAVEKAKNEVIRTNGKIWIDRSFEKLPGFCVGPALFEISQKLCRDNQSWAQKEIFGPVIHVTEYVSLIEAVEIFNCTEYALTGGIYSQSQDDIDFLLKFLKSGNLYVNRPNTGARVGIEPFGGFKMSGTGPKAGGHEYLKEFHCQIIPSENLITQVKWATDSGYQLSVPRPSLISAAGRVTRFDVFAKSFLDNFEHFTSSINEKDKEQLNHFVDWVKGNLEIYLNGIHHNHVIPGQLSFNNKSLVKESGLFVTVCSRPSLKAIYYLFASLALGCGVSVNALTDEAYKTWKSILDLAWKAGFSKSNIDCALVSPTRVSEILKQPHYSFVYAGGYSEYKNEIYTNIFEGEALAVNMRSLLSDIDGILIHNPEDVLNHFVWMRSLAINTMRHGAPLELTT